MASKNMVTLTFAGDHDRLTKSFDEVGASAKTMESKVDSASDGMASGFDRAGSGFDTLDDKAGRAEAGFRGTMDVMSGMGELAKGNVLQGMTDLGGGVSSLAQGLGGILVPALQRSVSWLAQTRVGILAQAAASKVVAGATKVWAGIQAAFNLVMAANPIVLVILAIVALVAIVVIAYKRSETFRKIVHAAFAGVVAAGKFLWEGVKRYLGFLQGLFRTVIGWASGLWNAFTRGFNRVVDFVSGLPRRVRRAASGLFNGIRDAFRNALNWIIDRWNGLSFTLPSVTVFGRTIGGATLSTPNLPRFHTGGIASGAMGREFLAVLRAGERVTPAGGGPASVRVGVERGDGGTSVEQQVADLLLLLVRTGALVLHVREGQVVV